MDKELAICTATFVAVFATGFAALKYFKKDIVLVDTTVADQLRKDAKAKTATVEPPTTAAA